MTAGKLIGKLANKEIKTMSPEGIEFLGREEGLRLRPYHDSVGIATIGFGNTYYEDGTRVKITDPAITKERAVKLFKTVLVHYEKAVWSLTRDDITQNQFDALVSITYNIGVTAFKGSTLLKRVNTYMSDALIRDAFLLWRNAGGKPILLERRKREAELYLK